MGNRTQMVATGGGAGTHSYSLDNLYRVTSVTYPGPTTDTYTFDQLGNRLTKNATSYTYDNADQMTAAGGTSYTYDANGNQITRGADTFIWDHENRLTQSVVGGVTSSSVYYGNGVRRSHTVNGVTTSYTSDVGGSLPLVLQDGTNTLVYGLDLISSTDGAGNQVYYSYDGLGSVTDLTDGNGAVTDTYSYDIFGAVRARTGTNASPWKFTGEQEDGAAGDSGYYFLRARYLDTATGRFISRDPLPFDQRYAYSNGNPVRFVDPSGLCRNPFGGGERSNWRRVADAGDCAADAIFSDQAILAADGVALSTAIAAAAVTDSLTLAGCAVTGLSGCPLGYAAGRVTAAPYQATSSFASAWATAGNCYRLQGRSFPDDQVCPLSVSESVIMFLYRISDPNVQTYLALEQLESDRGRYGRYAE